MTAPQTDTRTDDRKHRDEQIASESLRPAPDLSAGGPMPMEAHRARSRRPVAIVGVVENGLVRPLDPTVTLPERSRVIIVAQDVV
jgi:hypothetical protein